MHQITQITFILEVYFYFRTNCLFLCWVFFIKREQYLAAETRK